MNQESNLFNFRQRKILEVVAGLRPRLTKSAALQTHIQLFESVYSNINSFYELKELMEGPVLLSLTRASLRLIGWPPVWTCFD